ncbi:MAG TPA: hypothetical protein VE129_21330 [Thermoanaerobaculia bacterium]|nr:hypothetical protein [Thermoanaerobaculia bacterium]
MTGIPRCAARAASWAGALVVAGTFVGISLGAHRGLLLSDGIRGYFWPWAPAAGCPALTPAASALSDPVWQFVPWIELARHELEAGRLPLWNPHQEAGQPLLGNAQSALGSPLLWPALALPLFPGWNLSLLLRILVSAAGGWALAREFGRTRAASLLAAAVCGLSGPFVAWLEHPQTLTAAVVPWLLLAVRRASRGAGRWPVAGVAGTTALVLAGGHYETALMAAILATTFLLFESATPRNAARGIGGALLGVGLSAPVLLPFLEYLGLSAAWEGADRHLSTLPVRDLLRFVVPGLNGSHPIEGAAYLSLAVLPLAVFGAWTGSRERGTWTLAGAVALLMLAAYDNPGARLLAAETPVRWTRTLLLLPIPAALLAARGLDELVRRASRTGGRAAAALAFALAAGCGVELVSAARGVHAVTPPELRRFGAPVLDRLAADRSVFRVLPLHTFLPPNTATSLGLDDLRGYDALAVRAFRAGRERLGRFRGVPTQTDVLAPWDLAPGGAELDAWNVKYILLHPQFAFSAPTLNEKHGLDLVEVYSGRDGRLLQNRRVRPRARLEREGREEGRVEIVERSPTRWLFDVESPSGGTLVVANAGYPGWDALVEGRRVAVGGGVGRRQEIPVPAGRARVELTYRPASFRIGIVLAVAAAAILAVVSRSRPSAAGAAREGAPSCSEGGV